MKILSAIFVYATGFVTYSDAHDDKRLRGANNNVEPSFHRELYTCQDCCSEEYDDPCGYTTDTISDGSCNGNYACYQSTVTVDLGSCNDSYACYWSTASIGSGSCNADKACPQSSGNVGSESCNNGTFACFYSSGDIASGSCNNGDYACSSSSANIGSGSCNAESACTDTAGTIGNNACTEAGGCNGFDGDMPNDCPSVAALESGECGISAVPTPSPSSSPSKSPSKSPTTSPTTSLSRYTFVGKGVCKDESNKSYDRNKKVLSAIDETEAKSLCAEECIQHQTDQRGFQVVRRSSEEYFTCMCLYDDGKVPVVDGMTRKQNKSGNTPITTSQYNGQWEQQWCYSLVEEMIR